MTLATGRLGWLERLRRSLFFEPKSTLGRYMLPFAAVFSGLMIQFLLSLVISKERDFPYAFFYLFAIFVVAWFGGYGPGVVGSLLTMVALPWAAVPGFRLANLEFSRLILLIAVSLIVSKVAKSQRRSREVLSQMNAELEGHVQRRTADLARTVEALEAEVLQRKQTERKLQAQLERLNLLDQITRAIGERQDLQSVFQVAVRRLEEDLPIDFGCVCVYDPLTQALTIKSVGVQSESLATALLNESKGQIDINGNGLSRCLKGQLVYEPNVAELDLPFARKITEHGLNAVVAAPLLVESQTFGVFIAARRQAASFSSGDCEFLRQLSEHVALAAHQGEVYSALKRAYQDLRQSQQTVMQQERLRALGQMASGIAHDINNALSPVGLYTDALLEREPNLSARAREYLEITLRAIEDVAQTLARMREFYRPGGEQLALARIDLRTLVQQVLNLTRARWSDMPLQRGSVVELKTDFSLDTPAVAGIESEIREALINLVFNAVDAMPEGGTLAIRIGYKADKLTQPHVRLEVSDTGMGMSEETRRRCLEPFFTTKGERGTGLGLAMVYGMAQRHNAEIEIQSEIGKGTTIGLLFPVASAALSGFTQDHSVPQPSSRLKILVVDDDPLLIKSLRDSLEVDGHSVTTAHGGQEGIDVFENAWSEGKPYSIVLTDLGMPHVDGRKVAASIKMRSPATPVVMLTGWGQRLIDDGEIPAHVDRVLNKPPKLRELRSALADLTKPRATSA